MSAPVSRAISPKWLPAAFGLFFSLGSLLSAFLHPFDLLILPMRRPLTSKALSCLEERRGAGEDPRIALAQEVHLVADVAAADDEVRWEEDLVLKARLGQVLKAT